MSCLQRFDHTHMRIVISCNTLSSLLLSFLLWNTTASQFARYVIRQQNLSIFQIQNLVLILFESFGGNISVSNNLYLQILRLKKKSQSVSPHLSTLSFMIPQLILHNLTLFLRYLALNWLWYLIPRYIYIYMYVYH